MQEQQQQQLAMILECQEKTFLNQCTEYKKDTTKIKSSDNNNNNETWNSLIQYDRTYGNRQVTLNTQNNMNVK